MNKKILSLAVAAAMVAPGAAMAEAILYGKLNMSIDYADVTNVISQGQILTEVDPETGNIIRQIPDRDQNFQGWGLNGGGQLPGEGRANRIGLKGSEDLGNGLKAIYQVEFGIQMTEESNRLAATGSNNSPTMRNSFLGLAGDWGTFLVGRHDTPLKISTGKLDLFSDTMADYNGTVGFQDLRVDNAVAYISPSLAGFQLMGAVHAGGGSTVSDFPQGNIFADSISEGWSIAGIYSNGPFYVSAAYEALGSDLFMSSNTVLLGDPIAIDPVTGEEIANPAFVGDDFTKWRIGLGLLDWNGFTLTAIYEKQEDIPGGQLWEQQGGFGFPVPLEKELWQVQAGYAFGNNMVKAMYGSGNNDNDFEASFDNVDTFKNSLEGDYYTWAIGFDHNFSKRTKAYVLYTQVDSDDADVIQGSQWDGFSLGMMHSF